MKDMMWSDDEYDYIRIDGVVMKIKREFQWQQDAYKERQARQDALMGVVLVCCILFLLIVWVSIRMGMAQ
jgi:hypothetical protein